MTQTLNWRDAIGDAPLAPRSPDVRTLDLESLLGQFEVTPLGRTQVRNVLVRARDGGGHTWSARAALDTTQRSLLSLVFASSGEGRPDEAKIVARLVERLPAPAVSDSNAVPGRVMPVVEPVDTHGEDPVLDGSALESVRQVALRSFPEGSSVEWSDDVDESGAPLKLMTVLSPAPADVTHEAYLAFIHAWVRAEPPERRRRVRVSCHPGVSG